MKTILVSGASGIVGYGILRSLRASNNHLNLIGTSIYGDSVAPAFCNFFELAPHTDDPKYIKWLMGIIKSHKVDLIIPGIEIDMFKWAENIYDIEKSGAAALLNNINLIKLCQDKWKFYEVLSNSEMPYVIESSISQQFIELESMFKLPFLLKPRRGFASKGIVKIDSHDTFLRYQKDIGPILMAQPIIGNEEEEFTISMFCDGLGSFYAGMALKRKLSADGFTEKAEVVNLDEFFETISDLCKRFMPVGPTNFQFRRDDKGIKLLEINPRISSSTSIRAAFGYNESAMAVDYYLENRMPSQAQIMRGKAVRYTEEHIFYENGFYF